MDVLSSDAVKIEPGDEVILEQWGGVESLRGIVRLVEPSAFTKVSSLGVEEQRVNVIIDFVDPPEKRQSLGDGYRVEARIVIWEQDHWRFRCPYHRSCFDRHGNALGGQPSLNALRLHPISFSDAGHVLVDTGTFIERASFSPEQAVEPHGGSRAQRRPRPGPPRQRVRG